MNDSLLLPRGRSFIQDYVSGGCFWFSGRLGCGGLSGVPVGGVRLWIKEIFEVLSYFGKEIFGFGPCTIQIA